MVSQLPKKEKTYAGKIYTLADKVGNVFYVGCTINDMQTRLSCHISEAKTNKYATNPRKNQKIVELGFEITATIIDIKKVTGTSIYKALKNLRKFEDDYIKKYLDQGCELTNKQSRRVINTTKASMAYVGQTFEVNGDKITNKIKAA